MGLHLFYFCYIFVSDDDNSCTGSFIAARAMATLNFIMLLGAVVIVALKLFVFKDKPIIKSAIVFCFIGGLYFLTEKIHRV